RKGSVDCPDNRSETIEIQPGAADPGQVRAQSTQETALLKNHGPRRAVDAVGALLLPVTASGGVKAAGSYRPVNQASLLALQRSAGNRAVGTLLVATGHDRSVQRDQDAPTVTNPLRKQAPLLPGSLLLTEPQGFLHNKPSLVLPGGLRLLPAGGVQGLIDWGVVGTAYQDRQLQLQDRDRSIIVGHWQRWYPVAQGLYKLPLAKSLFDSPAAIMNTMTAKMIDSSLAGDHLNLIELYDRQAEQFGVQTTTVSVTVGHF
ncbi:MAG: hypothetical protein ABWZ98_11670, partial [Nakamurella sp.]